jgi:hypothetical protein
MPKISTLIGGCWIALYVRTRMSLHVVVGRSEVLSRSGLSCRSRGRGGREYDSRYQPAGSARLRLSVSANNLRGKKGIETQTVSPNGLVAIKKFSPHFPWPQQISRQRQNPKILSAWLESRRLWWREIPELARFARESEANPHKIYRIETDWRSGMDSNLRYRPVLPFFLRKEMDPHRSCWARARERRNPREPASSIGTSTR